MAERLNTPPRASGSNRSTLRFWGLLCLTLGAIGFAVVQNGMLNLPNTSPQALLKAMEDSRVFGYVSVALVLQAIHCCAAPLFAFLLVEGFHHTRDWRKYLLRVLGTAVLAELPFNLAVSGVWLQTDTRNPVFGVVLALVMLALFKQYPGRSFARVAIKIVVALAGILWTMMLGIQDGGPMLLLTAVLWMLREKTALRTLFGCVAAFACSLFSPFYVLSPIAFVVLHFYNGEKGESNPWVSYLSYPAILLVLGVIGRYLI